MMTYYRLYQLEIHLASQVSPLKSIPRKCKGAVSNLCHYDVLTMFLVPANLMF